MKLNSPVSDAASQEHRNQKKCPVLYLEECLSLDVQRGVLSWRARPPSHFKNAAVAKAVNKQRAGLPATCLGKDGYLRVRITWRGKSRLYPAHQIVWAMYNGEWPHFELDHIDADRRNNRPSNLREAERWQNMANMKRHRDNQTGFKGVLAQGGRYYARICRGRKHISLGSFATAEAAHEAYCKAVDKHFGEFGRTE